MARVFEEIDNHLRRWIERQPMFFVGTAPLTGAHVNCSPKGRDAFRILGPHTVAYLDMFGSGVETIAHLRENGRIVIMFCAFEGAPRTVRLHGRGTVTPLGAADFEEHLAPFLPLEAAVRATARSVITIQVARVSDSCGFDVPLMRYEGQRDQRERYIENRTRHIGVSGLATGMIDGNLRSLDGLPALEPEETDMYAAFERQNDSSTFNVQRSTFNAAESPGADTETAAMARGTVRVP